MIANRTTKVSSDKTVAEIQQMLASIRASKMMLDYDDGEVSAIAFQLTRDGHNLCFRLPSNWEGILTALKRERVVPKSLLTAEHAKRVSWRVIRDWLRAQLTLVEAGAAQVEEVMVPWLVTNDGTTVAARLFSGELGLLALPAPE